MGHRLASQDGDQQKAAKGKVPHRLDPIPVLRDLTLSSRAQCLINRVHAFSRRQHSLPQFIRPIREGGINKNWVYG